MTKYNYMCEKYNCSVCNNEIPLSLMSEKRKRRKFIKCVSCKKESKKKYDSSLYSENKEIIKNKVKEYIKLNKNKIKNDKRRYREKNIDKIRNYFIKYRENYKPIRNKREKERLENEPGYMLKKRLRNNILSYVKKAGRKKPCTTTEVIGCTYEEFKTHFESKFTEGMTWEIFCASDKIHIDHIIPVSEFDFTLDEEVKKCFHYTNLQPLWKIDNLRKSNKLNY